MGIARSPQGAIAPLSASAMPIGRGPGAPRVVFGLASATVSSVHIEPTHEIGKLYPIAGERRLMAFVVLTRARGGGTVVAEDEGGKILAEQSIGRPSPHPVASPVTSPRPKVSSSP
jgi:hypothetical protein